MMKITITEAILREAYNALRDEIVKESWDGVPWMPYNSDELFQDLVRRAKQPSKPPIDTCNNITYKGY